MDNNKENESTAFNGTIYHECFKFHRKYVRKKIASYWCCHNHVKSNDCTAKIKINQNGKVVTTQGDYHVSWFFKQSDTRKALGYIQLPDPQDDDFKTPPDMTEFMLKRAEEIALEDISMQPKKFTSRSYKKFN